METTSTPTSGGCTTTLTAKPESDSDRCRLHFKQVKLCDLPLINKYLQNTGSRSCDFTAGGIFMWIDYFSYEYCVVDNTLFIKGFAENDRSTAAFSLPLGAMPTGKSVDLILSYCRANGLRPVFSAIPEDRIAELEDVAHGITEVLDGWGDYLYDAETLATLSGKAMSKKRNHVNRFMAENPGWSLEPLCRDNLAETRLFLEHLENNNEAAKADPVMAEYEKEQCDTVLRDFFSYPFEGALLRGAEGKAVAFTVGEVIGDTLYVHIEKMDHNTAGAGESINKLFASYILGRHPGVKYINREDDAGDPGLRKAKESYHPLSVLKKYNFRIILGDMG